MSCRIVYDFIAQTRVVVADPVWGADAAAPPVAVNDILRPNAEAEAVFARHMLALAAGWQGDAAA